MRILAIESTCDETAAAIVESFEHGVRVIKSVVASSAEIHQKYGGVVPEVAAREHIKSIIPVITEALGDEEIDAVAVSYGPGLMGSLLIGVETTKALAWAWDKPLLKVNHMMGHVMANWIVERNQELKESRNQDNVIPILPGVGLVVSGGHTDLILMKSLTDWEWIGGTRDDAVGEAFDKAARILGLPYPGGPEIEKASQKVSDDKWKKMDKKYRLPRSLLNEDNLEMSFSGIKAALARLMGSSELLVLGSEFKEEFVNLVAREFSEAVIEVLIRKTLMATDKFEVKSVIMAGGVAANKTLRERLKKEIENRDMKFFVPELKYCGDNAAMIGAAAILRPVESNWSLKPEPSLGVV